MLKISNVCQTLLRIFFSFLITQSAGYVVKLALTNYYLHFVLLKIIM